MLSLTTAAFAQDSLRLTGSGATFPFPIYSAWFKSFSGKNKGVTVDYQGKGSGAGIQDFLNHTVDFAASDAAMSDEDMAKVQGGVQLLPMTAGEIVLAYNLPGNPKGLKLPRYVYAGIFLGKITKWSDAKLKAANNRAAVEHLGLVAECRARVGQERRGRSRRPSLGFPRAVPHSRSARSAGSCRRAMPSWSCRSHHMWIPHDLEGRVVAVLLCVEHAP